MPRLLGQVEMLPLGQLSKHTMKLWTAQSHHEASECWKKIWSLLILNIIISWPTLDWTSLLNENCNMLKMTIWVNQVIAQRTLTLLCNDSITERLTSCLTGLDSTETSKYVTNSATQPNPNKINRRSAVQWSFPLWSKWVFSGLLIFLLRNSDFSSIHTGAFYAVGQLVSLYIKCFCLSETQQLTAAKRTGVNTALVLTERTTPAFKRRTLIVHSHDSRQKEMRQASSAFVSSKSAFLKEKISFWMDRSPWPAVDLIKLFWGKSRFHQN